MPATAIIKKYGNRRLYDTDESKYVTLEELAEKVRTGTDVRVIDAQSGDDLTQATLAQIILESRSAARRLPVPLLVQLIRMDDEALAEFLGRYVSGALELYLHAKHGAQQLAPYVPMANLPFQATNAFARLLLGAGSMLGATPQWEPRPMPPTTVDPQDAKSADVDALRREVDELRRMMQSNKSDEKKPAKKARASK